MKKARFSVIIFHVLNGFLFNLMLGPEPVRRQEILIFVCVGSGHNFYFTPSANQVCQKWRIVQTIILCHQNRSY
jgi:hypothetical protein